MPGLFPENENDIKGIFVLDYISAVKSFCEIKVFIIQFTGNKKGLHTEVQNGIKIYRYSLTGKSKISTVEKMLLYPFWFIKGYITIIKEFKEIKLIHTHGGVLYGTLAALVKIAKKIPFVNTEHTGPFSKISSPFFTSILFRFAMKKCACLLTVSNHLKNEVEKSRINTAPIKVTYNPVDTELFNYNNRLQKTKNILFAGRLESYKGGFKTVKAFHTLINIFPEWTLTIIGNGPEKIKIENYIVQQPELKGKIFLKGKLPKAQIATEMNKASLFVFPSEHETFGLVVAEAMAAGLPVITTKGTAMEEYVNEKCGLLVSPEVESIATAMQSIIPKINEYNSLEIRNQIVNNFSFGVFGERMQKIYQQALCVE